MHSLLSVFNPLHSNINIYAYSPYFSLCSDKENLLNNQELFLLVIISSILMTVMFNLGMILQGWICSLSLYGVWGLEKVNVQIIENLVCLAFLFTLQQDVSKIGILKDLSCTYFLWCMYFCCRQRKLKCKDLKRENNCTFCSKVQNQKMSQGTHSLFVWDKKCFKETFRLVET